MVHIDTRALGDALHNLGDQLAATILEVVEATMDEPFDSAANTLRRRLAFEGVEVDDAWCRNAVETLRRGDDLEIDLH